jgi:hypothetical protein
MEITHKYWTMWTFLTLTALTTAPCLTAQVPDYMLKSVAPSQSGSYPGGLAIDAAGNVYYCGTSDGAIWKIPTTGKPSAFAGGGNSTNGLIGDGGTRRRRAPCCRCEDFRAWPAVASRNQNYAFFVKETKPMNSSTFLLLNLALAFYNAGTIWAHEVDIFRSWKLVDPVSFHRIQAVHWRKVPYWVFLPTGRTFPNFLCC